MNRWVKFGAIGCASLFGIVVILIVLVAAISGTDTAPPDTAATEDTEITDAAPAEREAQEADEDTAQERELREAREAEREARRAQREAEEAAEDVKEEAAQAEAQRQEAEAAEAEAQEAEAAPPPPEEEPVADVVTIRVNGEAGQTFTGSYGNIDTTQSVDGIVPQEFEQEIETGFFSADVVTAVMQKNSAGPWELTVEIVANGEVVEQTSTTAEYGVATVTWDTLE